jgi:hypothetical protein
MKLFVIKGGCFYRGDRDVIANYSLISSVIANYIICRKEFEIQPHAWVVSQICKLYNKYSL